jgi:tetratricopeptide (TPR) repeat protein
MGPSHSYAAARGAIARATLVVCLTACLIPYPEGDFYKALALMREERYAEAVPLLERALEDLDDDRAQDRAATLANLGTCHFWLGEWEQAEQAYRSGVALADMGAFHSSQILAHLLLGLGASLHKLGRNEEAEAALLRGFESIRNIGGTARRLRPQLESNLASVYGDQGRYDDAEALYRKAMQRFAAAGDEEETARVAYLLGRTYLKTDRAPEAVATLGLAVELHEKVGTPAAEVAPVREEYALALEADGKPDQAAEVRRGSRSE